MWHGGRIVLLLGLVATVCHAGAGLNMVDGETGDSLGDGGVTAVENVALPDHVVAATEGSLWNLRRKNDVVVLAVTQHYDCPTCASALKDFAVAASAFKGAAAGTVKFAVLDAEDEADEFSLLIDEHPDAHWLVPAILVLKREYQDVYRRPPFSFLLNQNTGRDLPRFVARLIGPDQTRVSTEDALLKRIRDDATDRVSFVIWPWYLPARNSIEKLVADERLHSYYTFIADGALLDSDEAMRRHNPAGDFFTAHTVKDDGSIEVAGTSLGGAKDFAKQLALLRQFVETWKRKRPGHEDDGKATIETEDLVPGGSCDGKRQTAAGDRVMASGVGVNLHTGTRFLSFDDEEVLIGEPRGDLPHGIASSAFLNLCAPAKRKIVLPPGKHYGESTLPPDVTPEDSIRFELQLHSIVGEPLAEPEAAPFAGDGATDL